MNQRHSCHLQFVKTVAVERMCFLGLGQVFSTQLFLDFKFFFYFLIFFKRNQNQQNIKTKKKQKKSITMNCMNELFSTFKILIIWMSLVDGWMYGQMELDVGGADGNRRRWLSSVVGG